MADNGGNQTRPETLSIVGMWELVSVIWTYPDGRATEPWGVAAGRLAYDAAGNMMALLMHEARNEAGGQMSTPAAQSQYSAYFGTYRVDTANGVITHQVTGSLQGENASGELRRDFKFAAFRGRSATEARRWAERRARAVEPVLSDRAPVRPQVRNRPP